MPVLIVLAVIIIVPLIFVIATYNSLVQLRNHISDAWANIDTELKRRYELIPNLVNTVKGYATHEKEVFEKVTELRSQCIANTGHLNAQPCQNQARQQIGSHVEHGCSQTSRLHQAQRFKGKR